MCDDSVFPLAKFKWEKAKANDLRGGKSCGLVSGSAVVISLIR